MICRVCDSTALTRVIDLGLQPWGNNFLRLERVGKEECYPLRVVVCEHCATAQLDYTVKKEIMFSDHTYISGTTKSLNDHFSETAAEVDRLFGPTGLKKRVLDIGSNDGTQLKYYQRLGYEVLGVESSVGIARSANSAGVPTLNRFFDAEVAATIGTFGVINASGVFFHLEDLHSVTEGIRRCLEPDGVFVVQFLYMKRIVENCAFDQIYHEHLLYYTLRTIARLLERHGLALVDAYVSEIHGGSVIGYVKHRGKVGQKSNRLVALEAAEDTAKSNAIITYQRFASRILEFRKQNCDFLERSRRAGKRIWGLGAPVKGNTLLNYLQVDRQTIEQLVERNPLRRGMYAPGSHIPVVIEDELSGDPDIYYVLAWNFKREILRRYANLIARGVEFYFPIDPDRAAGGRP